MASPKTIDEIFATCTALYPLTATEKNGNTLDLLRNIWHAILSDLPDELLQAVALDYFRHAHEWRPTPGHLYDAALKASEQNVEAVALEAWQQFREWDYGRGVPISDPLVMRAIRSVGGADYIGQLESAKVDNYVRREFLKVYQMLKESEQVRGGLALTSGMMQKQISETTEKLRIK